MRQPVSRLPFVTLVALVWCVGSSAPALAQCEITPVTASDGFAGQKFGWSTAISGDYAVVGTDEPSSGTGATYVYERDGLSWNEMGRLVPEPPLANDDEYGRAVAISGRVAVVGARKRNIAGRDNRGAVYVFRRNLQTGVWEYQQELTAADGDVGDLFGGSVAIDGDWIVVGAPENDEFGEENSGTAYAFYFDGSTWSQARKFRADDQAVGDQFGNAVAISGNWVVVASKWDDDGCPKGPDASNSGSVYTFFHDPAAAPDVGWEQRTKLQAQVRDGATVSCDAGGSDNFGHGAAISGDRLVVGAVFDDDDGSSSGSAYVYRLEEPDWVIEQKLTASDGAELNNFGRSVAIHDDLVLVGASKGDLDNPVTANTGSAYLYRRAGTEWIDELELTASDAEDGDRFGQFVSIGGDYAAIGAYRKNGSTGSAYIFAIGVEFDCNENGIHDDCEVLGDSSLDANNNGTLDSCECLTDGDCVGALPCISGTCDQNTHLCVFAANPGFCAIAGTCFSDAAPNPLNECELCNHALSGDEWSHRDAGSPCGDPLDATCDRPDTCDGGGLCLPNPESAGTACTDDGNECTDDQCDGSGNCGHPNVDDLTACTDDGNECTDNRCVNGQCAVFFRSEGAPCRDQSNTECDPADTCDGAGNCLDNIRDDGTPCFHDGLFCTGEDLCQGGACESAGDPCTANGLICDANAEFRNECSCDREVEGFCDDGLFCSGVEVCTAGVCLSSGDPCNGTGLLCDEATDTCACGGFSDCDDGIFCNGAETCVGDVCVSAGDPCSLPTPFCDEVTDTCVCISDADCEDGDECTGVESCNAQGICRHALVFDCNANGLEDACDVDSEIGDSRDCNDDGVPDECEVEVPHNCCQGAHGAGCSNPQIAACVCAVDAYCCDVDWDRLCAEQVETLECGSCDVDNDCNGNGVPDACDLSDPFTSSSPQLSPIDDANPQSYTIVSPPQAAGNVMLTFTASADLQASSESINIDINETAAGTVFRTGASDCPITPDAATLIVPASVFNDVVADRNAVITMTPGPNVDVGVCAETFITVRIEYEILADCNTNDVLDECETIGGGDFDSNGVVDLGDYGFFADCLGGPKAAPTPAHPSCIGFCLDAFDLDGDGDADLYDVRAFQLTFGVGK